MAKSITFAKIALILGICGLMSISYIVRGRLLDMLWLTVHASDITATEDVRVFRDSAEDRQKDYEVNLAAFNAQLAAYREQMNEFLNDPDAYKKRMMSDGRQVQPPQTPMRPIAPYSPAIQDELLQINQDFRASRQGYFHDAPLMNVLLGCCAITVVASLVFLICFDPVPSRISYLLLLVLSFVFLIGPALYSMVTATVYRLPSPVYAKPGPPGYGYPRPY